MGPGSTEGLRFCLNACTSLMYVALGSVGFTSSPSIGCFIMHGWISASRIAISFRPANSAVQNCMKSGSVGSPSENNFPSSTSPQLKPTKRSFCWNACDAASLTFLIRGFWATTWTDSLARVRDCGSTWVRNRWTTSVFWIEAKSSASW